MRLRFQLRVAISILALIAAPITVTADAVTDWNAIAVQAVVTAGASRPGPSGSVDIAMVQAAVYDAVQAYDRRFKPYVVEISGATGSPIAATAKAAHDILVNRFPAQSASLDTTYQQYLANNGLSENDPGVAVGAAVAATLIARRACDGSFPSPPPPDFIGGTGIGVWRPTPPGFLPMAAPWLATMTPFTLTRPSQFRAEPPPAITSQQYTDDYNEVKSLGSVNSTTRTPQQTDQAQFWAGNFLVIWNEGIRNVALRSNNTIGDNARLFALAGLAMADATITSWDSKKYYVFWRPITAIREGDNDGNPNTIGDTNWTSLITNPNYPDYTSGANNITGAATHSLQLFFGTDNMVFKLTTTNVGPTQQDTRVYTRLSDAAQEVVDARIYLGIHFRFADTAARTQGSRVADWVFEHFLRPINEAN